MMPGVEAGMEHRGREPVDQDRLAAMRPGLEAGVERFVNWTYD
jgi:hypothetical protein